MSNSKRTSQQLEDLHPDIKQLVLIRVNSHIDFILDNTKPSLYHWIFGNPASSVIGAMRAELAYWGIHDV